MLFHDSSFESVMADVEYIKSQLTAHLDFPKKVDDDDSGIEHMFKYRSRE